MDLQTTLQAINQTPKGKYVPLVYQKKDKGFTKTVKTVVRFIDYFNIKSVKANGNANQTPLQNQNPAIKQIVPHILTFNQNTGNYLLHCYPTNNHKQHIVYQNPQGQEIDKATYELAVPPKHNGGDGPKIVFQIKIQDIVSIG